MNKRYPIPNPDKEYGRDPLHGERYSLKQTKTDFRRLQTFFVMSGQPQQ